MLKVKKSFLLLLGALISFNGGAEISSPIENSQAVVQTHPKESGLMLDIARHFYPPEVIKSFIDTLSEAGGTFLHLHFSDDENYALESELLNQRVDGAIQKNGIYINPHTQKPFLSYQQIKDIKDYAKLKGIEIIPELDSPAHMRGIFRLLQNAKGKDYVQSVASPQVSDEINMTNPQSIAFIQDLLDEVINVFANSSRHIHIGGDEFGYDINNNEEFIGYANTLTEFLRQKGLKARMWNDGLIKKNLDKLDSSIEITYWSFDGDKQDTQEVKRLRSARAALPDLLAKGFKVLNYNSYYLYLTPESATAFPKDAEFAKNDLLKNWDLGVWDGENKQNKVANSENLIGAALSIWGENAKALKSENIQKDSKPLLKAVIQKTNLASQ